MTTTAVMTNKTIAGTTERSRLLAAGLHPLTDAKLRLLGVPAVLIGQVIGDAPLSAGFHAADGQWFAPDFPFKSPGPWKNESWVDYTAAVDLKPARFDMKGAEVPMMREAIYDLVSAASLLGICMFFRHPGFDGTPLSWAEHIHLVDAGLKMKPELSCQVTDFCAGLNGLKGHAPYSFFQPSKYAVKLILAMHLAANK